MSVNYSFNLMRTDSKTCRFYYIIFSSNKIEISVGIVICKVACMIKRCVRCEVTVCKKPHRMIFGKVNYNFASFIWSAFFSLRINKADFVKRRRFSKRRNKGVRRHTAIVVKIKIGTQKSCFRLTVAFKNLQA